MTQRSEKKTTGDDRKKGHFSHYIITHLLFFSFSPVLGGTMGPASVVLVCRNARTRFVNNLSTL